MSHSKRFPFVSVSDIDGCRGFQELAPHVQAWLRELRPVSHAGVRAWVASSEEPFEKYDKTEEWTPSQIALAVDLIRPRLSDLVEYLGDRDIDLEDSAGGHPAAPVWKALYEGRTGTKHAPADSLFGLSFAVDGICTSSSSQWTVLTLSAGLALFCTDHDDRSNSPFPYVLGAIDLADPIRSAALLLHASDTHDPSALGVKRYDELHAHGLHDEDVFRLLLAHTGRASLEMLLASRAELRAHRPSWSPRAFTRLIGVLHQWDSPPASDESTTQIALPFDASRALPLFDGYPYLMTRLAPALYNLIVLPAEEEDRLIDVAQAQAWANKLPTCLIVAETRAIFYDVDGSPTVTTEPPRGGNVISGHLAPVREFERTTELRGRERQAARFIDEHRGTGYVMGDLTKGGYEASAAQLEGFAKCEALDPESDDRALAGLHKCADCGDWRGTCLDPNPAFEHWVVKVSCFCDNGNRCAACGDLLWERKLAANFYDPSDGQVWHVPGFMGRCKCADAVARRAAHG